MSELTAGWLLEKREVLEQLAAAIAADELDELCDGDFEILPVRLALEGSVAAFIHADHIRTTGDDPLGFIRISGEAAIGADRDLVHEAMTRAVIVVYQRLQQQTRVLEAHLQHERANDWHTVLVPPRAYLGWVERNVDLGKSAFRALLLCGPGRNEAVGELATESSREMRGLALMTRSLMRGSERSSLHDGKLGALREAIRANVPPVPATRQLRVTEVARALDITQDDIYRAETWDYAQWCDEHTSTLSDDQLAILHGDALRRHPLRIFGPAGSGKTLLMQLMALRHLEREPDVHVLYLTHNTAMEERVSRRFITLGGFDSISKGRLMVNTLGRFAADRLALEPHHALENEPDLAKASAFTILSEAISRALERNSKIVTAGPMLSSLTDTEAGRRYFDEYVRVEISSVIKGGGTILERADYTLAEQPTGRLQAALTRRERDVVYDAFEFYETDLKGLGAMDADDIAISMLGRLTTPQWRIQREEFGFDYVFVDEAQLFNDNERRIFGLLTNQRYSHSPVAIALDDAQRLYDPPSSGLALFGLPDVQRVSLHIGHRLSADIARLALFVLAHSTTLYEEHFPDYAGVVLEDGERLGERPPQLITTPPERFARRVNRIVRQMRKDELKHIAIIAHTIPLMERLSMELPPLMGDLHFWVLNERGAEREITHPFTLLSRPELIGGQEFDGVICCGLEAGMVPPRLRRPNAAFEATLEQQALHEMYLCFTRARHQLVVVNSSGTKPTRILELAAQKKYILTADGTAVPQ
jgi:superfamily I DNA/RNA helicase